MQTQTQSTHTVASGSSCLTKDKSATHVLQLSVKTPPRTGNSRHNARPSAAVPRMSSRQLKSAGHHLPRRPLCQLRGRLHDGLLATFVVYCQQMRGPPIATPMPSSWPPSSVIDTANLNTQLGLHLPCHDAARRSRLTEHNLPK
jgi:hypothetical protein